MYIYMYIHVHRYVHVCMYLGRQEVFLRTCMNACSLLRLAVGPAQRIFAFMRGQMRAIFFACEMPS